MNRIIMFLKAKSIGLLIGILWATLSCFTPTADPTQAIGVSIQSGEAHQLASYFDKDLELRIDPVGVDFASVQAGQAELIMRSFFRKYPPLRFRTDEQGSTPHLRYATGTYWSGSRSFHINVLMRQATPGQYRIHSIQVNE
ncbi:DUF4783 domain-containing protein [uncultured Fibrella sp.]|uniref:DUF4783 domain-containing protein n=1 Tax=uncultured Fibrella sp. TaxID=1284596 RepID=UPI0035C993CD